MAPESCNFGKDDAEMLKASSSASSSSSSSSSASSTLPSSSLSPSLTVSQLSPQQSQSLLSLESLLRAQRFSDRPQITSTTTIFEISSLSKHGEEPHLPVKFGKRCLTCRKRIGLTGFRCRCGDLFCARHRYSDTHNCTFDYKAVGREEISKANPVVRAAKIIKI